MPSTMLSQMNQSILVYDFRSDAEITGYALDAIYNVVSNEPSEEGKPWPSLSRYCILEIKQI